jgi:hypothetical protein
MQVTPMTREVLEACIRAAFPDSEPPPIDELLQPAYAANDDAHELAAAFAAKRWTEVSRRDVFRHRQMIFALSGVGFRAYAGAYLLAALDEDPQTAGDFRHGLLDGLEPASTKESSIVAAAERLSRLDGAQRAAIADVLRYLGAQGLTRAVDLLRTWGDIGSGRD